MVIRAEEFQPLKFVEPNLSFANGDNQQFKLMFPDSKNARNYSKHEIKMKYSTQFGIAPYVKTLIKDVKGQPFRFKFDDIILFNIIQKCRK